MKANVNSAAALYSFLFHATGYFHQDFSQFFSVLFSVPFLSALPLDNDFPQSSSLQALLTLYPLNSLYIQLPMKSPPESLRHLKSTNHFLHFP